MGGLGERRGSVKELMEFEESRGPEAVSELLLMKLRTPDGQTPGNRIGARSGTGLQSIQAALSPRR